MSRLRTGVAIVLEAVCYWVDELPDWTWRIPLLHRLGCPRGLALLAFRVYPSEQGDAS